MYFVTYVENTHLKKKEKTVNDFVKRAYLGHFSLRLGDQDKT